MTKRRCTYVLTSFVDLYGDVDAALLFKDLLPEMGVVLQGHVLDFVDVDVVDVGEGQARVVLVGRHGRLRRRLQPLQKEEEDGTFLKESPTSPPSTQSFVLFCFLLRTSNVYVSRAVSKSLS